MTDKIRNMSPSDDIIQISHNNTTVNQDVKGLCYLLKRYDGLIHEKDIKIKVGNAEIVLKSPPLPARVYNFVINGIKKMVN